MWQVIKETTQYMWRSEKNRLFMLITTALVIIYSFFVLPHISGEKEVDIEMLEREMNGNVVQFEEALNEGLIVPSALTGTTAYSNQRNEYVQQRELLTALKQGDVKRYISIPYRPDTQKEVENSNLEQLVFGVFGYETEQPYQQAKNKVYIEEIEDLSFHTVHERTSAQQIHLFLMGLGPILLLLGLVFLASDIHVKDRSLKTQKIGHPLSWQKYLWIQALTALGFVTVFYIGLLLVFILLNSFLHGFGSLALPIGYYDPNFELGVFSAENFQIQTIGWFILRALPFLALLSYLFIRLNTLFSLWTRQAIVTMVLGVFTILFQFIYYDSEATELLGQEIHYFPQTYLAFGKIITGRFEQETVESMPQIFKQGLLILLGTILVIEILIYLTSKKITRQVFVS